MGTRAPASLLLILVLLTGCGRQEQQAPASGQVADAELAAQVVASEELILELTPRLNAFDEVLFSEDCLFTGLDPTPEESPQQFENVTVSRTSWRTAAKSPVKRIPQLADLLAPTGPGTTARIGKPSFAIIRGEFTGSGRNLFMTEVSLAVAGDRLAIESHHSLLWKKVSGTKPGWQIVVWVAQDIAMLESAAPLFEEVLDVALPDAVARAAARTSMHQRILVENYFGGKRADLPAGYSDTRFYPDAVNMHPAVSVVDVDGDGHDDLYICVRWGRNQLLRNRGDGTFEECAARFGLDIDGRNAVALFADFDNDGDPDLLLGRSLERSLFLINRGGKFSSQPEPITGGGQLPWLVTSGSVADINNDGLLDAYLCTYSPLDINTRIHGQLAGAATPEWAQRFLPPDQAAEVTRLQGDAHSYLGQVGPPNVMLINRGGGQFETSIAPGGYRNTFHAAWNDFDSDGDQDLYVANDFSPDGFFRNDGAGGFTNIAVRSGVETLGFAMGAAWGDYDGDGHDDLYVSNMYSKAGRRVTAQIPGLDQRFASSAGGNFLFKNRAGKWLERLSGADDKPIDVHRAGWSWGGQFCDFDNDGHLDLYVSSGFYTPPAGQDNGADL